MLSTAQPCRFYVAVLLTGGINLILRCCYVRLSSHAPSTFASATHPPYRAIRRGPQKSARRIIHEWYNVRGILQQLGMQKLLEVLQLRARAWRVPRPIEPVPFVPVLTWNEIQLLLGVVRQLRCVVQLLCCCCQRTSRVRLKLIYTKHETHLLA